MTGSLGLETMILRLVVAIVLGAVIGMEREFVGKGEAGIRTDIMVAGGAAIFTIVGMMLPYIISTPDTLNDVLARNSGFLATIANIVVGVGFLGAGIIVKQGAHVHGLTTAATIWYVAAIGVLCGIGLLAFAVVAALGIAALLLILRKLNVSYLFDKDVDSSDGGR